MEGKAGKMRILIVEDDFISRKLLQKTLSAYGDCDIAVDGKEAIEAFRLAIGDKRTYDLICLDIMMPHIDGISALKEIRKMEKDAGVAPTAEVKVIMTTALNDPKTVVDSLYRAGATSYIVKPINTKELVAEIKKLGLLD